LGYEINKENRLMMETGYFASEMGSPGRAADVDLDDRQESWNHYFDLTWEGACWEDSKILAKAYTTTDRLEFIESLSPILSKTANQTEVYGADLQISHTWFDALRATIGASGQENRLNSSTSAKHKYNFKAAYGEAELNLFKSLTLKGGARIDDYSNFGSRTSPSASFSYWLFDKIKAHGLIGKSFRAPTFNDLFWPKEDYGIWGGVEGNPNLKPEIATSREIGLGAFIFDKIELDATYFYNKFRDLIAWQEDNAYWWRPSNVNAATIKGVETNLTCQITKSLNLNMNYTRLSALNDTTKKWLTYRPRHEYKATVYYNLDDKLKWYLTGRYISKRYATEDNSRFVKSYFTAYTSICYNVTKFAEINLTVNNIFDRDYQEVEGYPMPGTNFLLGAKLKF
jgi:outer membrane receptor for ferrienterochelin and colicins